MINFFYIKHLQKLKVTFLSRNSSILMDKLFDKLKKAENVIVKIFNKKQS